VNLADFYLVRRGHYSIADITDRNGAYGRYAWRGIVAFLAGFAAMIPFMSLSVYTGPVPKAIGGADLSFFVGLIVAPRGLANPGCPPWSAKKALNVLTDLFGKVTN
jgi:purine-cytosine permease-like protein